MATASGAALRPIDVDEVRVRAASLGDLDALVALENECFVQDRISRRSFRHFLHHHRDKLIVAESGGRIVGYILVIFRSGTALARVYSVAVLEEFRGGGIGAMLLDEAEAVSLASDCMVLRLEVREDNDVAIALYKRLGYRIFGRYPDYYEDHANALRLQKWLKLPPSMLPTVPYYQQTTDFTCGPAVMMMGMAALDRGFAFDRRTELQLWREATTIYMSAGHGGCEPIGMALALARRGFEASVHVSEPGPFFLESVRDPDKREVMAVIQEDFREMAESAGIPVNLEAISNDDIVAILDDGGVVAVLISHYRMTGDKEPHWVLVYGHDTRRFFIHDPWVDHDELESEIAAAALPIPYEEFDRMAKYGKTRLRAAVVITRNNVQ